MISIDVLPINLNELMNIVVFVSKNYGENKRDDKLNAIYI
jgi:hypothetical protein